MKKLLMLAGAGAAFAAGAFEVENVTACQRWPWNSCIDIDYEITGAAAGDQYAVDVTATYAGGTKTVVGKTYKSDPVAVPGSNRLTWDFGADAAGVKANDLRISVKATPFDDKSEVYCVIDVSGGKNATKYPVRYVREAPVHTPNCTTDVCKLTEIWLRRVHPASRDFTVYSWRTPSASNDSIYSRLTKDYYIGVFEITQQQWYLMTGNWPSAYSNLAWRATRPMDRFYTELLFGSGGWQWPDVKTAKADSLLDKLQKKTGLMTLNLPTETQYHFALTAGPTKGSEMYRYKDPNGKVYAADEIMRYAGNRGDDWTDTTVGPNSGTACVGTYKPNNFGLYDMMGNVSEQFLDPYVAAGVNMNAYLAEHGYELPLTDFAGIPRDDTLLFNRWDADKVRATSCYGLGVGKDYMTLWHRTTCYTGYCFDGKNGARGLRLCVTCE